jgi:hypothetical protein
LENLNEAQWKAFLSGSPATTDKQTDTPTAATNPMTDTSLRRFKRGTVLRYGFEVYNAKLDAAKKPNLTSQIRVFREGQMIFEGKTIPVEVAGQTDLERVKATGAVSLATEMKSGDYILQIIITDNLAKEKRKISTQFVQFEIIE